ncbi:MAG: DUF5665 domain-containing protein [Candidatus Dojkabacteria bacterium]
MPENVEKAPEVVKAVKATIPLQEDMSETLKSIDHRLKKLLSLNLRVRFVTGLIQGLGFVLGTTVLLALTILILRQFITIPLIGQFVSEIINVVERK